MRAGVLTGQKGEKLRTKTCRQPEGGRTGLSAGAVERALGLKLKKGSTKIDLLHCNSVEHRIDRKRQIP